MSLFAEKWSLPFNNNPFGLDDFPSRSFGECRSVPHFSLFGKSFEEEDDDFKLLEMKLRNGSLLAERGFYDHFDSVFHDRSRRYDLRAAAADQNRRSPQVSNRGKEYVIPIRIETSPKRKTSSTNSTSGTALNASSPKNSTSGASPTRVIEIPVVRETSTTASKQTVGRRDKSRSPVLSHSCKVPTSSFTLLTPTTDDSRSSQRRDTARDIVLDSDDFFTTRTDSPRQSSKPVSDLDIVDVDDDDYFTKSLRRKPLRHFQNTSQDHVFRDPSPRVSADSFSKVKSSEDDVGLERKTADDRKGRQKENESKGSVCCHPGPTEIAAAPSYPVYDDLMPILASQDRQIDYIRGDGNCFFRAISKDVYGTEDCHAECRQAVCDLIQDHPDVFRQYIDDGSVTAHVIDMRVPSTWATTCEIYAAATLLRRDIYVLAPSPSSNTEYHWLLFSPRCVKGAAITSGSSQRGVEEEVQPCYVTLCHTNANHYDRITPITARCNCQLDPPSLNGKSVMLDLTTSDCEHSQ